VRVATKPILALLAVAALAGCGSDNPEEPSSPAQGPGNVLPAEDIARVDQAVRTIRASCADGEADERVSAATRTLVQVFRAAPDGIVDSAQATTAPSMTDLLESQRDALRRCGATDEVQQIQRALDAQSGEGGGGAAGESSPGY